MKRDMLASPTLAVITIAPGLEIREADPSALQASQISAVNTPATSTISTLIILPSKSSYPVSKGTAPLTSNTAHVTSSDNVSYQTVKETVTYTATPSTTAYANQHGKHTGLSSGGIAGVVITIVAILLAATGLAFFFLRQRRGRRQRDMLRDAGIISPATELDRHEKDGNSVAELHNQPLPLQASSIDLHEMATPASELEGQMPERYQKSPVEIGARSIVESSTDQRRHTRSLKLDPNTTKSWLDTDS